MIEYPSFKSCTCFDRSRQEVHVWFMTLQVHDFIATQTIRREEDILEMDRKAFVCEVFRKKMAINLVYGCGR